MLGASVSRWRQPEGSEKASMDPDDQGEASVSNSHQSGDDAASVLADTVSIGDDAEVR